MMHSLLQVPVKSAVFGRFCFARAYRDRSETYRQRNINSKHTVHRWQTAGHRTAAGSATVQFSTDRSADPAGPERGTER